MPPIGAPIRSIEVEEVIPIPPEDSGSYLPLELEPLLYRIMRVGVPRCHFEIKGEAFMVVVYDDNEPRSF